MRNSNYKYRFNAHLFNAQSFGANRFDYDIFFSIFGKHYFIRNFVSKIPLPYDCVLGPFSQLLGFYIRFAGAHKL